MTKFWTLFLAMVAACSANTTEPDVTQARRPNFAAASVTLTPSTVASLVGDLDSVIGTPKNANGTVCGSCAIAWRILDSTKLQLVSTFKPAGQSKPNGAVIRSLAPGTAGLRGGR